MMIINQRAKICQDKINALLNIGAVPNLKINYYGKDISASDVISKFNIPIRI